MIPSRVRSLARTALRSGAPLFLLTLSTPAFQAPESLAEALDQHWRWTRFGRADGLPEAGAQHVLDDGESVVVGTEVGLFRFDGWRFQAVALEGAESDDRVITALVKGPEGRRWASTSREVFVEQPGGAFRRWWTTADTEPITRVLASEDGVFAQTVLEDAVRLTRLDEEGAAQLIPMPVQAVGKVWNTDYGDLWFSTHKLLFRLVGETWQRVQIPGLLVVHELEQTASGQGALACTAGPPGNRILEWTDHEPPRNSEDDFYGIVRSLALSPTGEAVVVYDANEIRIRESERWISPTDPSDALRHARHMWFRPNGDLWVSAQGALWLIRRTTHRWSQYRFSGVGNPRNRLSDFAFDSDGNSWLASGRGITARRPDGEVIDIPQPQMAGNGLVTGIAIDDEGSIWISSGSGFEGVIRWDGHEWHALEEDTEGLPIGLVHKIRKDSAGTLWLLSLSDALESAHATNGSVFFLKDGRAHRWSTVEALGRRRFYDFVETADGARWLASDTGVHRYFDSTWQSWTNENGLRSRFIACLAPKGDKSVWAGHDWRTGLLSIHPRTGVRYNPLGDKEHVAALAVDPLGPLWFSSRNGINRIEGDRISNFGSATGLEPTRVWPIQVIGNRVFAGSLGGGLVILEPEERSYPPPRVTIQTSSIDSGVFTAAWRPNDWWGARPPEEVPTRYRIDDEPWSPWSLHHEVERAGFEAGTHTLEVEAIGLFGDVAGMPATRTVHTAPPTWRQPLFVAALGAMVVAFSTLATVSLRRRRRDARELRRSEAEYRSLMEQASDGFFLCDEEATCRKVNPRGLELMQRDRQELVGAHFEELFTTPPAVRFFLKRIASGENHLAEFTVARPGEADDRQSSETLVELSGKLLDDGRLQIIARDVTRRRRLESERRQLERRLMESQKNESLAQLAGGVAHEFNNLLLVVSGNTEAALPLLDESHGKEHLQKALGAVHEAGELTHQLLAYGGISAFEDRCVDLRVVVSDVAALLRVSIPCNVALDFEQAGFPLPIDGDPGSLRQVLVNLVMDAAAAIGERPGKVTVQTHGDARMVRCVISDNGPGLDEAACERAFDPFVSDEGNGLGLAAARGIVEAHGGRIGLKSWLGYGRSFTVQFPRSNRRPETPDQPDVTEWEPAGCVLIVDDEPGIREVLSVMIERIGFETLIASGGREGLRLFESNRSRITCALVDLSMPDMSGLDVVEKIKEQSPSTTLILMSGYSEDMFDRRRVADAAILRKPFSFEELQGKLRSSADIASAESDAAGTQS